ncbi:MAG: transglutaminase domain-containing protein [Bacteroidaceae bacterium]|nr:transglutaminase domain-containing protein [Bacteroidaceae bacterium]
MKIFLKVVWGIFAFIGILIISGLLYAYLAKFYISIRQEKRYDGYVQLLRTSGALEKDTVVFEMKIIQDTIRAKEILNYFNLDSLYDVDAKTWTKALSISQFVASNIPHDNQKIQPQHRNAIDLWEYTKNVAPAFNCRMHSILTFELMLAAGLDARYVTCLPEDEDDTDCHVVNEVWLPELGKWAMIDTDMDGHFISDLDGVPLSLKEIREHYISGEDMVIYDLLKDTPMNDPDYTAYMAKNTYWFRCPETLSYYQEDSENREREEGRHINLVPAGFVSFVEDSGNVSTSNADIFWAPPIK